MSHACTAKQHSCDAVLLQWESTVTVIVLIVAQGQRGSPWWIPPAYTMKRPWARYRTTKLHLNMANGAVSKAFF